MIENNLNYLRGFFPYSLYIGGSWALNRKFPEIEYKDIDIFVLGPRKFESWALEFILKNHFEDVEMFESICYLIPNQYKRAVCYSFAGQKFDFIFLNDSINSLIRKSAGSTLAQIYYKLDYSKKGYSLEIESREAFERLKRGELQIWPAKMTDDQYLKTMQRKSTLGLKIIS